VLALQRWCLITRIQIRPLALLRFYSTLTGDSNTAVGVSALQSNTEWQFQHRTGFQALFANTIGSFNTADGGNALLFNNGVNNTATGYGAAGIQQ
jgi:hypothetical protein